MDVRFLLVLVCFLLSGFAGLLYETAWTREFSFVFGTSNLAVATVLAAYMGGLSLGAALAARFLHRIRRPVLTYGLLELGVALTALAVPAAIRASSAVYVALFGGLEGLPQEGDLGSALFYLGAAFVILGVPTALMGATLPLLARHAVREEAQIGRRVGALYATNTLGAIAGTLTTAFLLLPTLGLQNTIFAGAAVNAAVFAFAALLARGAGAAQQELAAPAQRAGAAPAQRILAIAFATGVASFTYEVLWTRLLEHVLGGSIYAFATMLASFLVGIALGGAAAARLATSTARSLLGLALAEIGVAAFSLAAYLLLDQAPSLVAGISLRGDAGMLARAGVGALILLPSTLCIGATFPFLVRAFTSDPAAAGQASARVYAWNTLGAIVGSVSAGFWTIPLLAFSGAVAAAAGLSFLLALLACTLRPPGWRALAAVAAAGVLAMATLPLPTPWRLLRSSPLFGVDVSQDRSEPPFYEVGRSATVILLDEGSGWRLRTNGLPEALIDKPGMPGGISQIANWMRALPAFVPNARRQLVIGLGGGGIVDSVPPPIDEIDVIEIEESVVTANQWLSGQRARDPLLDPRVHVLVNDARGALALSAKSWDGIVSQPSHPWTAGASHLYTRDFFRLVRERLAPAGVFVQWMGLGFVDAELLRTLVATMLEVFPNVRVYQPEPGGLLLVGSAAALDFETRLPQLASAHPEAFARVGLRVAEDILAALVLDEAGARAIATGARISTDDDNELATRSPYVVASEMPIGALFEGASDPLLPLLARVDTAYLARRLGEIGQAERGTLLARRLAGAERDLALGEIALATGERTKALGYFERALETDPTSQAARFRVLQGRRRSALGAEEQALAAAGLSGLAAEVVAGWRLRESGAWDALRELDPRLASRDVREPALHAALELRVDWRLATGARESALEAVALLDAGLVGLSGDELARRALAGVRAGRPEIAARSLALLPTRIQVPLDPRAAEYAREALAELPADALSAADRAAVEPLLGPQRPRASR